MAEVDLGRLFPKAQGKPMCGPCSLQGISDTDNPYGFRNFNQAKRYLKHHLPSPTLTKSESDLPFLGKKRIGDKGAKRIASFPDKFVFCGDWKDAVNRIGNSVPPMLMRAIALQIKSVMFGGQPLTPYPKTMSYLDILESAWQDHLKPRETNAPTVISTFAGGGGSSLGYSMAGYRELLAVEWDNNAVETFRLNFPEVPVYHGDIAKLSVEECLRLAGIGPGELDVLDGSPPCFPAGIDILTEQCKIPIEFVTTGMKVLTHTGKFKEVLDVFKKTYQGQLYTIKTKYGRKPVTCTAEHPFFVRKRVVLKRDNRTRKNGTQYKSYLDPQWLSASQLEIGDVILEPHINEVVPLEIPKIIEKQRINLEGQSGKENSELRLLERDCNINWQTNEMAWVLGFYLAEGHTRGKNPTLEVNGPCRREVVFSVAEKETVMLADRLIALGFKPTVQKHTQGSSRVTITSINFWALCKTMGRYADGKFIPNAFYGQPIEWQKQFLDGYFSGDGCIVSSKRINSQKRKATTISWNVAIGIARMIAKVYKLVAGIEVLYPAGKSEIEGREVDIKEAYSVGYALPTSERVRPGFVDEYGAWIPISQIDTSDGSGTEVYNFEVEEDNSYTANDFAVHNCQGFSTAGKRILDDPRNQLFREYVRLLRGLRPKVFVMENVSGMVKGKMKLVFAKILRELKASGYRVSARLLNAMYFNVPQSRERMIFIGIREDLGIEPSHPKAESKPITPKIAFDNCPDGKIKILPDWLKEAAKYIDAGNYNHKSVERAFLRVRKNKAGSQNTKLLSWDRVSCTLIKEEISVTGIIHPNRERYLTIPEMKRIASFPDEFQFVGKRKDAVNRIGNSVPPLLMR